jgi:uncharacterized protein (DUF1501 family)
MHSRRNFIRVGAASVGTLALRPFGAIAALAGAVTPAVSDYKALVCVFLFGGNDGNNVIVPITGNAYDSYASIRKQIALPASSLLPIAAGAESYGLHASLKEVQALYTQHQLAFVVNVGNLVQPLTRAQYTANSAPMPSNLFSHSDQQLEWQTSLPAENGSTGWGGRLADVISPWNAPATFPAFLSVAGNTIQGSGVQTRPATVIPGSPLGLDSGTPLDSALEQLFTLESGVSLVQAATGILANGESDATTLSKALDGAKALQTQFPKNSLGVQLAQVANIISVRSQMGMKRQIFFCSLGGFDTHGGQLATQSGLLTQFSQALNAFYEATQEMGVANQVTTFTESDFSRTLSPTSNDGSDHAWGNHHMVMGGGVKGGTIYGTFPELALGGPDDTDTRGRWIPGTSAGQYGATLASWFGVGSGDLVTIFPTLANFKTQNLGFV